MAERDWIKRYFAPLAASPGADGLTDDTALLGIASGAVVITTDAMVEGVHFLTADPIASIARKLVRVNVSDVLSSGAEPGEALLTLGWPQSRPESQLAEFAAAFGDELAAWGIALIGGDTVSSPNALFLSLTLTGKCIGPAPIRRGGARPGDDLWITGEIGGPRRGFLARAEGVENTWTGTLRTPVLPPLATAGLIARHSTAAMDVSDGLLGDARSLAEASGAGVEIALDLVPFAGGAADLAEMLDLSTWGDDYQLLFTAPAGLRGKVLSESQDAGFQVTRIGQIRELSGLAVTANNDFVNLPETVAFEHGRIGIPVTRP